MKFLHQTTEYQLNENLKSAFAYIPKLDLIQYNPTYPSYEWYDMNFAQAHELSHRMDELLYRSWENEKFVKAVENTSKIVYNYIDEIKEWYFVGGKYEIDMALSDIISALTKGDPSLNDILYVGHKESYWKDNKNVCKEIFANLSAITVLNSESKAEFKGLLKEIYEVYKELIE